MDIEKYKDQEKLNNVLKYINNEVFKDFTKAVLNKYSSEEKLDDALDVSNLFIFMLKDKGLLNDTVDAYFVNLAIIGSLLHNISYSYNKDKWYEVFKTREYLEDVNKDFNIPDNYITPICTVIEQQLGVHIPTKALIPNPNTPSEFFATACAIYYKFQK